MLGVTLKKVIGGVKQKICIFAADFAQVKVTHSLKKTHFGFGPVSFHFESVNLPLSDLTTCKGLLMMEFRIEMDFHFGLKIHFSGLEAKYSF